MGRALWDSGIAPWLESGDGDGGSRSVVLAVAKT